MKLRTNLIFQGLGVLIQVLNYISGIVPAHIQPYVMLVVTVAQALVAWRVHWFNPDGTSVAVSYQKAAKKAA